MARLLPPCWVDAAGALTRDGLTEVGTRWVGTTTRFPGALPLPAGAVLSASALSRSSSSACSCSSSSISGGSPSKSLFSAADRYRRGSKTVARKV